MKKAVLLLFLLFGLCEADMNNNRFAVLLDGLLYVKNKDAQIAIKVWLNELASEDYDKEIVFDFYETKEKVFEGFANGNIEYLTLNPMHYLQNRSELDQNIKDLYIFSETKDDFISYVLVTKNSDKIKSIKDLKNYTIGIEHDDYLELLYLDHTLLKNRLPIHQKYFSEIKTYKKDSRALMKLFFSKVDACIVPKNIWEMMTEMNPQIAKKLKIIDQSEKIFVQALSLISKKMNDKLYQVHYKNAKRLQSSPKGQQILTLLKSKVYKSVDKAFMDPMVDYYQEYLALKKR